MIFVRTAAATVSLLILFFLVLFFFAYQRNAETNDEHRSRRRTKKNDTDFSVAMIVLQLEQPFDGSSGWAPLGQYRFFHLYVFLSADDEEKLRTKLNEFMKVSNGQRRSLILLDFSILGFKRNMRCLCLFWIFHFAFFRFQNRNCKYTFIHFQHFAIAAVIVRLWNYVKLFSCFHLLFFFPPWFSCTWLCRGGWSHIPLRPLKCKSHGNSI